MNLVFRCDKHFSSNSNELEEGKNKTDIASYSGEITFYVKPCQECIEEAFNKGYDEAKQALEDAKEIEEATHD